MSVFRIILAAIDFSDSSRDVLGYASALAHESQGDIHALHVAPDPMLQPWSVDAVGVDWTSLREQWTTRATQRLSTLITEACAAPLTVTPVVVSDTAANGILRYATEISADVIVMGTHGYGPVKRFLLGSVVERVLREAPCPVLTVPHGTLRTPPL